MATTLGDVKTINRLTMQFKSSIDKNFFINLDNPKSVGDGYADLAAEDAAIEAAMNTVVTKNIFHDKGGNDITQLVNARRVQQDATDVMDVG